jgi:ribosomal protein L30E
MSQKAKGFKSEQFHCPYRFKCDCYVALSMKYYPDNVVLLQAGNHDLDSHAAGKQKSLLSVKQRGAVKRAARSAPLQVGRQVHDGMLDFSPGKHIPYDRRTQGAVNRLVRKTRKEVMARRIPGVGVDGTEGSMNRLAESLSLANKAGLVVYGYTRVEAAIREGIVIGLVEAQDGSESGRRKLESQLDYASADLKKPIQRLFGLDSSDLGLALGRSHVIHAALTEGPAARASLARLGLLDHYRAEEPISDLKNSILN